MNAEQLTLFSDGRAQASVSSGAEGCGMSSGASASVWRLVKTLPAVLAGASGSLG